MDCRSWAHSLLRVRSFINSKGQVIYQLSVQRDRSIIEGHISSFHIRFFVSAIKDES